MTVGVNSSNENVIDERFKNILEQLNNSNIREQKLHNELTQLKEKLKKKE